MKIWKSILLGVVGAGLISWNAAQAVTIRNGPSGNSKQENVVIALLDVLNTDGSMNHTGDNTHTGSELFNIMNFGTETVTLSADDPGVGTASATLSYHAIVSDATGSGTDTCSVLDGTVAGRFKVFNLKTDGETTGMALTPVSFGPGTDLLFEDAGDGCILMWDGTNWQIVGNHGGTVR